MKIVCTICTDTITNDFAAAPCGHTFHFTCLSQWLAHQKTCPQCRERCLPRNVIKLFIDANDSSSREASETLDPEEIREKLDLQANLLKHKDKALSEARGTLKQIREEMQAWQAQHETTHRKLKNEQAANSALKKQLCVMQYECDQAKDAKRECSKLKQRLSLMEGLQKVLTDNKEEVETLVKNYTSPAKLATFVVAMKRDYESLKERKLAVQKEKDKVVLEMSYIKKQLRSRELELQSTKSRLGEVESDLHAAEQERESLGRKVQLLERALESPGSKAALRRILESPMPDATKRPQLDLGASPLLVQTSSAENGQSVACGHKENFQILGSKKRSNSDDDVLLPINKISKKSSETFASGFNGMGGQSNFAIPKSKPRKPGSKGLKFAPRSLGPPKPKPAHPLPALQLKF